MLAIFGIGPTELIILVIIGGVVCLPALIGIVVLVIIATQRPRQ